MSESKGSAHLHTPLSFATPMQGEHRQSVSINGSNRERVKTYRITQVANMDIKGCGRLVDGWVLDQEHLEIVIEANQTVESIIVQRRLDGLCEVGVGLLLREDIATGQSLGYDWVSGSHEGLAGG